MERGGEYLLAHMRDDVGRKSGESVQGIVLYVRSEKLYALRKSYLNLHAIQRTASGARSLSTLIAVDLAGAPSVQSKICFEVPLSGIILFLMKR